MNFLKPYTHLILRIGLSGTFIGHGILALKHTPNMVKRVSESGFVPFMTPEAF